MLKMLSDNTSDAWPLEDLLPSGAQLASNSGISVGSIDARTAKHQFPLGTLPPTPSMPLRHSLVTRVRDNLSFPGLLGKDLLELTGPETLPEKFEKNLSMVALAYDSVRARLVEMSVQFSNASLEISRDPEQLGSESLLVAIRVSRMPYKEILKLWDRLSFAFAERLDKDLMGNVHLVLRPSE